MELQSGDAIEVVSNKVEQPHRSGVVERVLQQDPLRVEVRWEDGHTSVFMPSGGNVRVREHAAGSEADAGGTGTER
ncbi:DUF1918 domain-containing protein [Egicoccus sp. AB-alg2]|uniref:DUF1918 domain-containing protein n=1 Tax=Egicoccus sp. AB-alg2 TaxID=3242693 RepID=UPI00359D5C74